MSNMDTTHSVPSSYIRSTLLQAHEFMAIHHIEPRLTFSLSPLTSVLMSSASSLLAPASTVDRSMPLSLTGPAVTT